VIRRLYVALAYTGVTDFRYFRAKLTASHLCVLINPRDLRYAAR